MITLLFQATARVRLENGFLKILGNVSYEIYLVHGAVIMLLMKIRTEWKPGIFVVAAVTLSFLLALIIHAVSKKAVSFIRK